MPKLKVFVMEEGRGKILINPAPAEYESLPHVVDPSMDAVRGIPPELCFIVNGAVVSNMLPRIPKSPYKDPDKLERAIAAVDKRLSGEIRWDRARSGLLRLLHTRWVQKNLKLTWIVGGVWLLGLTLGLVLLK